MASSDTRNILKGAHRLVLTPTDLTAAFPYGGTEVGLARNLEFRWGQRGHSERAEEWGGAPVRRLWSGDWAVAAAVLRSWDSAVIAAAFPTYVLGDSGRAKATYTADDDGERGGRFVSGVALLIVPLDSPTSLPSAIIYNALPIVEGSLSFSRRREAGISIAWEGGLDATGRVYDVGLLEDLSV